MVEHRLAIEPDKICFTRLLRPSYQRNPIDQLFELYYGLELRLSLDKLCK